MASKFDSLEVDVRHFLQPSIFWATPRLTFPANTQRSRMQILGSELSALGKSPEYCLNYVNINTLKKGGLVAVRVEDQPEVWTRGRVVQVFHQVWENEACPTYTVKCFLIDWGQFLVVDNPYSKLRILPNHLCQPGLAKLYNIERLVPLGCRLTEQGGLCMEPSSEWSLKAIELTKNLQRAAAYCIVKTVKLDEKVFPLDLLFQITDLKMVRFLESSDYGMFQLSVPQDGKISLTNVLLKGKFASTPKQIEIFRSRFISDQKSSLPTQQGKEGSSSNEKGPQQVTFKDAEGLRSNFKNQVLINHINPPERTILPLICQSDLNRLFLSKVNVVLFNQLEASLWPILKAGQSALMIYDGKTKSYVAPLIDMICSNEDPKDALDYFPDSIVVCSSSKSVLSVSNFVIDMAKDCKIKRSRCREFKAFGIFENEEQRFFELTNGCNMLVTTPLSLLRMLEKQFKPIGPLTSFKSCRHVVFEDVEDLIKNFNEEIDRIIKQIKKHTRSQGRLMQFVVAAREWSSDLHKLVNKISNSNISKEFNIIVSNVLELPIVGKMQTRVEVLNNVDEKQQKVLKIIDEEVNSLFIACESHESALTIYNFLCENGLRVLKIGIDKNGMNTKRILETFGECFAKKVKIVVIILDEFIDDVVSQNFKLMDEKLVHFDIPAQNKHDFAKRFLLFDIKISLKKALCNDDPRDFKENSIVLLDRDLDRRHASFFLNLFQRQDSMQTIPQELFDMAKEFNKINRGSHFCNQIKETGSCNLKPHKCLHRHEIIPVKDLDKSILGPEAEGSHLSYVITEVISPVRFLVRLLEMRDPKTKTVIKEFKSNENTLNLKLNCFTKTCLKLALSDLCLLKSQEVFVVLIGLTYKRAEFIAINSERAEIEFLLIDEGHIYRGHHELFSFFKLPDEASEIHFSRSFAEVVLCGLKPKDGDKYWSKHAKDFSFKCATGETLKAENDSEEEEVSEESMDDFEDPPEIVPKIIRSSNHRNDWKSGKQAVCRSKLVLALGNSFFVEKIQIFFPSPLTKRLYPFNELKKAMLEEELADINSQHLIKIIDLVSVSRSESSSHQTQTSKNDSKFSHSSGTKDEPHNIPVPMTEFSYASACGLRSGDQSTNKDVEEPPGFVGLPTMPLVERCPSKVEWYDDLKNLTFDIHLSLESRLKKNQIEIRISESTFSFRYLEMIQRQNGKEEYVLHNLKQFTLYDNVLAKETTITCLDCNIVKVELKKVAEKIWKRHSLESHVADNIFCNPSGDSDNEDQNMSWEELGSCPRVIGFADDIDLGSSDSDLCQIDDQNLYRKTRAPYFHKDFKRKSNRRWNRYQFFL